MVELSMRVNRLERELKLDPQTMPLVTFARGDQHAPAPDYGIERAVEPCGCEESVCLRERVRVLEAALANARRS